MAFNIDGFKSNGLVLGGARPTLFKVYVTWPSVVPGPGVAGGESKESFLISAASLPASLIDEVRVPYFGRQIKLAGDRVYQDWEVSVYNDEDFSIRNAFEAWHNAINSVVSNRLDPSIRGIGSLNQGTQTLDSYKKELFVQQLAKAGPPNEAGVIRQYRIVGAFPTSVGAIPLDWGDTNRVEQFSVNFAYDYWEPYEGTTESYNVLQSPD